MMNIKVLGTGCASCKNTLKLIDEVAQASGVEIALEKVEDVQQMMRYPIMSTPAVVIDEHVVHSGGVPSRSKVEGWLNGTVTS